MVRIAEIKAGSVAESLELEIGTRVIRINGEPVRDGIDFTFLTSEAELELEMVSPDGVPIRKLLRRGEGESLGLVPAPDPVRECANKCVFCFIDGNPAGARQSLWLRDDDFRLSFTYGSYVTLTNLGPRGLQRLIDQRISPLYVSVHATDPELRRRLLKNDRAGLLMEQLEHLLAGGVEVHTQVVLCPGWNDGAQLDRTMADLYGLGPGVRTLSVVPVGLTRYNVGRPVRPLSAEEARRAIDQVSRRRTKALRERRQGWVYAADELYLRAGRALPPASYYDSWDLTENGVGSVVRFLEQAEEELPFLPRLPGRRLHLLTGTSMAPFLENLSPGLADATGATVRVLPVRNRFYGELVTVAGLMAGRDALEAVEGLRSPEDLILIPGEALNAEGLFVDSVSIEDFKKAVLPAGVSTGRSVLEALEAVP